MRILIVVWVCLFLMISTESIYSEKNRVSSILLPDGYKRITLQPNSFEDYLRNFPLKGKGAPVYYYNGRKKASQKFHFAVLDIDTGSRDLQQCADAVMRLRAEYLYSKKLYHKIKFNLTSGDPFPYSRWAKGERPLIKKNRLYFIKKHGFSYEYRSFRKYLDFVFVYAGSYSLSRELISVSDIQKIQPGNVFIQGGFPGHAVIVMDTAIHNKRGDVIFLLAQSYMPAQDIHILLNLKDGELSPWYSINFRKNLETPEWIFHKEDLKKFRN
ncbi:MAG: DUF4846 domain-containing protein [Spirochaetia bacterium]|nr:DUF4846 domain-containing protein [Spirochaetia bacterium]